MKFTGTVNINWCKSTLHSRLTHTTHPYLRFLVVDMYFTGAWIEPDECIVHL
jgi:hypothetical protein